MTDSDVKGGGNLFLGIAGREFRCDTNRDILDPGAIGTFVFGGDANVEQAAANDPQTLSLEMVAMHPVYIRYESSNEEWCVERVEVNIETAGNRLSLESHALDGEATLWRGDRMGRILYLHNPGLYAQYAAKLVRGDGSRN